MSQMVGIGPFITILLILAVLTGPLAIAGWVVGAPIATLSDAVRTARTRTLISSPPQPRRAS